MDFFEQIEAYLNDQLSEEARIAFEAEMQQNPELARAVKHFKATQTIYEVLQEEGLRTQIKNHFQTGADQPSIRRRRQSFQRILAVAAGVLLLIAMGSIWYASGYYSNRALVQQFTDLPNLTGVKGEQEMDLPTRASHAFSEMRFAQVIDLLAPLPESDPFYGESQHMLAYACLMEGKSAQAIDLFAEVIRQNQPRRERAEWHLVLAYLQNGDLDTVENRLQAILADRSHAYHAEANQLQQYLYSRWRKLVAGS